MRSVCDSGLLPRLSVILLLGLSVGSCGGRSEHVVSRGSGGAGGAGGSGATGGSSALAGSTGAGGSVSTGSGGSSAVAGGSAGTGGTLSIAAAGAFPTDELPVCLQPIEVGSCRGAFQRWAFDPGTLQCVSFVYGGCEGNENAFTSFEDCETACVVPLPDGCSTTLTGGRPEGCPCTDQTPCAGICNSPSVDLVHICQPADVGYCKPFRGEGDCFCRLDGSQGCGV